MRILSIDPGFDKLGYAFFDKHSDKYDYLSSGLVQTEKTFAIEYRLEKIYARLKVLIEEYKPEIILLEQLFFFKNAKTVIKVAMSQGIILLLAAEYKLPAKFLTPLQIKQIVTGYGASDKKAVVKMLSLLMKEKLPICEDDESDAIACGLAYCYLNEKLL